MTLKCLVLGGRDPVGKSRVPPPPGWHLTQLSDAAKRCGVKLHRADYESLQSRIAEHPKRPISTRIDTDQEAIDLNDFDAILTRTMPAGSLEQITFRLATLHQHARHRRAGGMPPGIINPPASLELAIDKYATLARAASLGFAVPGTIVVQNRAHAMEAFDQLGGDVVVKPIFGGEGRGVMRIRDRELAWTTFSTLAQLGAVAYVQEFIPPGGVDIRLLVIGKHVHAIRRRSVDDFRTNVRGGGRCERLIVQDCWAEMARAICGEFELTVAAIDFLETTCANQTRLVEVNAIPGWRGAQSVTNESLAEQIIESLRDSAVVAIA